MTYFISAILGYLLGSIPTAYLLLKKSHEVDITELGSKNVGAMNAYEVTNSKKNGIIVFLIDFLKGTAAYFAAKYLIDDTYSIIVTAIAFTVLGHCFSIWIKFKGGRGLATAAGGLIFLAPSVFVVWSILWIFTYIYKRNIHFSNLVASLFTAITSFTSVKVLSNFTYPTSEKHLYFSLSVSIIMLIILIKHYNPLKQYFLSSKTKSENNYE